MYAQPLDGDQSVTELSVDRLIHRSQVTGARKAQEVLAAVDRASRAPPLRTHSVPDPLGAEMRVAPLPLKAALAEH